MPDVAQIVGGEAPMYISAYCTAVKPNAAYDLSGLPPIKYGMQSSSPVDNLVQVYDAGTNTGSMSGDCKFTVWDERSLNQIAALVIVGYDGQNKYLLGAMELTVQTIPGKFYESLQVSFDLSANGPIAGDE